MQYIGSAFGPDKRILQKPLKAGDFSLASIQSDEHLAEAQRVMDGLLARGALGEGEETYLDALSDLAGSYEDEHHAIGPASDADMLRHLMDAKGVSQMQLSRDTGLPKSTISEVLAGKKAFSRQMIRKLADLEVSRILSRRCRRVGGKYLKRGRRLAWRPEIARGPGEQPWGGKACRFNSFARAGRPIRPRRTMRAQAQPDRHCPVDA